MSEATPHLRNILDLLEIRGCQTEFQPQALGPDRGAWVIFYPTDVWGTVDATPFRSRMIYSDTRGELQAMALLKELNAGVPDTLAMHPTKLIVPKALEAVARNILKLQEEQNDS